MRRFQFTWDIGLSNRHKGVMFPDLSSVSTSTSTIVSTTSTDPPSTMTPMSSTTMTPMSSTTMTPMSSTTMPEPAVKDEDLFLRYVL